jgi:hypothetical protein
VQRFGRIWRINADVLSFTKSESMISYLAGRKKRILAQEPRVGRGAETRKAFRAQPRTRVEATADFFIWICSNPLKMVRISQRIQGNASFFPWIYLVFLGFI